MQKQSAGILLYRIREGKGEVFLVHPGGPYWAKKDLGAWSIPKGEFDEGESPLEAARREVEEETGLSVNGEFLPLTPLRQPSRKLIHAFAIEGDYDASQVKSNSFELEWPPKSGRIQEFPEIDRAAWFDLATAHSKLIKGQIGFLDEFIERLQERGLRSSEDEAVPQHPEGKQQPLF